MMAAAPAPMRHRSRQRRASTSTPFSGAPLLAALAFLLLVLAAGLNWRQVAMLRGYCNWKAMKS